MRVILSIDLDESWDGYENVEADLFIEDLFAGLQEKDGVKDVSIIDIKV